MTSGSPSQDCDVIIVGAGIAGLSAAFELAETHRVVVLEQEPHAAAHATSRSAAAFIEPYGNEVVQSLTAASKDFFFEPPSGFCEVPLVTNRELFQVATAGQEEELEESYSTVARRFSNLSLVSGEVVEQRIPLLRSGRITLAMYDPGTKDIDVGALVQGYLRGAVARGAEIRKRTEVTALERTAGQWKVETGEGSVRAPIVVNAGGAWVERIALAAGASAFGLTPLRRSMFVFDPGKTDVRAWPLVADVGEQWYFKPESGLLLGSPSEEDPMEPCDADTDDLVIATGADQLEKVLDLEIRHIEAKWAGLRTFAPDRCPVVGFDPEAEGFFWLAGQGGFGIQTAPAVSRLAAALLRGRTIPDDLTRQGVSGELVSPKRLAP